MVLMHAEKAEKSMSEVDVEVAITVSLPPSGLLPVVVVVVVLSMLSSLVSFAFVFQPDLTII